MKHLGLTIITAFALELGGCTESLYLTSPKADAKPDYIFVAPYFGKVTNKINIGIVPATPPKDTTTPPGLPTLTVTLVPSPAARSYLFFSRNAWFNNTFNVSVGADGMLTSSDSTSVQQFSAILTELAQTAAPFLAPVAPGVPAPPAAAVATGPTDDPSFCSAAIAKLTSSVALYASFADISDRSTSYPVAQTSIQGAAGVKKVVLTLDVTVPPLSSAAVDPSKEHSGFIAYMPVPVTAAVSCRVAGGAPVPLSQPSVLSTYFDSRWIDPQRDLLTDPAETFTLSEGFLIGHKYSDQSSAKTVIDTVTAPIRALFPQPSVQQSVQVQTGGGKPDQTTSTTQITSGKSS